jgi:hypothetical protein
VLLLTPFFDLGVDFKVFSSKITRLLSPWSQKVVILTLKTCAIGSTTF